MSRQENPAKVFLRRYKALSGRVDALQRALIHLNLGSAKWCLFVANRGIYDLGVRKSGDFSLIFVILPVDNYKLPVKNFFLYFSIKKY